MSYLSKVIAATGIVATSTIQAQTCNLSEYKATPGLMAEAAQETVTITWDGEKNDEIRLRLSLQNGTPAIQDVALRHKGGAWVTLATNLEPEFQVVSGL